MKDKNVQGHLTVLHENIFCCVVNRALEEFVGQVQYDPRKPAEAKSTRF